MHLLQVHTKCRSLVGTSPHVTCRCGSYKDKSYLRVSPTGCNHEITIIYVIDIGVVAWQPNILSVIIKASDQMYLLVRCRYVLFTVWIFPDLKIVKCVDKRP